MYKLDILIESTLNNMISRIKGLLDIFKTRYFKDFSEKEFEDLLSLVNSWYYGSKYLSKKIKTIVKKPFIRKLKVAHPPSMLYRGLSFQTEQARTKFIEDITKNGFTGNSIHHDLSSWTSNRRIALKFTPGGPFAQDRKYGVLCQISGDKAKAYILFSISHNIKTIKDRKEFLLLISKIHSKNLEDIIQKSNPKQLINKPLFGNMHGAVFAVGEDEYALGRIPPKELPKIKLITKE